MGPLCWPEIPRQIFEPLTPNACLPCFPRTGGLDLVPPGWGWPKSEVGGRASFVGCSDTKLSWDKGHRELKSIATTRLDRHSIY